MQQQQQHMQQMQQLQQMQQMQQHGQYAHYYHQGQGVPGFAISSPSMHHQQTANSAPIAAGCAHGNNHADCPKCIALFRFGNVLNELDNVPAAPEAAVAAATAAALETAIAAAAITAGSTPAVVNITSTSSRDSQDSDGGSSTNPTDPVATRAHRASVIRARRSSKPPVEMVSHADHASRMCSSLLLSSESDSVDADGDARPLLEVAVGEKRKRSSIRHAAVSPAIASSPGENVLGSSVIGRFETAASDPHTSVKEQKELFHAAHTLQFLAAKPPSSRPSSTNKTV
jgi:hypothetical protein